MSAKGKCYLCEHVRPTQVPYNCHMACLNTTATVEGNPHGIKNGWFLWPSCFDPVWLLSCDGFRAREGAD